MNKEFFYDYVFCLWQEMCTVYTLLYSAGTAGWLEVRNIQNRLLDQLISSLLFWFILVCSLVSLVFQAYLNCSKSVLLCVWIYVSFANTPSFTMNHKLIILQQIHAVFVWNKIQTLREPKMTSCWNPAVGRKDYGVDDIRSVVTYNNATGTEFNSTKSYMASIQSLFLTGWHSLMHAKCQEI